MSDVIFRLHDGWYCLVGGRRFGPWPLRQYAEAGMAVERRRADNRAQLIHEERGSERAKAEGRLR